jgi:hypothetical protein
MSWKRLALLSCALVLAWNLVTPARAVVAVPLRPVAKIKITDADNHTVILNRVGMISVVIGTSEDSQDAARRAGRALYPFQGMSDFQEIVVVDLRGSIAAWVPSVVVDHMRRSLDEEALELKPYFLKNGNKSNPRRSLHVAPDFTGNIVPQFGWTGTPDQLHAIMYGADGRELRRWEDVGNMDAFQAAVRQALQKNAERAAATMPVKPK